MITIALLTTGTLMFALLVVWGMMTDRDIKKLKNLVATQAAINDITLKKLETLQSALMTLAELQNTED